MSMVRYLKPIRDPVHPPIENLLAGRGGTCGFCRAPGRGRPLMNLQSDPHAWTPNPSGPSNDWAIAKFGIGQPVLRTEDPKLVRGEGRFTDDVGLPGQAYAVMVRSRHAHGVIRSIDT